MDIRKTDNKGRISVGHKGVNYITTVNADGSITLTPVLEAKAEPIVGMRIFNRPMGAGKTTELVKLMLEPGNEDVYFVAPTRAQAEIGHRIAQGILSEALEAVGDRFAGTDRGKLAARFLSSSALEKQPKGTRYVIDEIDGVIGSLIGGPVLAIAGTDGKMRADQIQQRRDDSYYGGF